MYHRNTPLLHFFAATILWSRDYYCFTPVEGFVAIPAPHSKIGRPPELTVSHSRHAREPSFQPRPTNPPPHVSLVTRQSDVHLSVVPNDPLETEASLFPELSLVGQVRRLCTSLRRQRSTLTTPSTHPEEGEFASCCFQGLTRKIDQRIVERHERDCNEALQLFTPELLSDASSAPSSTNDTRVTFESIYAGGGNTEDNLRQLMVIRSKQPVLNETSIQIIRQAVQSYFERSQEEGDESGASRFTYQRPGNSEAHVADLGSDVRKIMDELLLDIVYPSIRDHFPLVEDDNHADTSSPTQLLVYDALFIRYNATEANLLAQRRQGHQGEEYIETNTDSIADATKQQGAGQPLHRDLGFVSVNIMLNSPDKFQGGGTFFENQLRSEHYTVQSSGETPACDQEPSVKSDCLPPRPLKPFGPGHCLMHRSSERHAGANTIRGVRDVMVVFVTVRGSNKNSNSQQQEREQHRVPAIVRSALLKQSGPDCESWEKEPDCQYLCKIEQQCLAIEATPNDGEAYQYLGNALMRYHTHLLGSSGNAVTHWDGKGDHFQSLLWLAIQSYTRAACDGYSSCDARVYNNLGLGWTKWRDLGYGWGRMEDEIHACNRKIQSSYEKGLWLVEQSRLAGCDVDRDRHSLRLNLGLFLANLDFFQDAIPILHPVAISTSDDRIVQDARTLLQYCQGRL